jgi:hypothetical protein
VTACSLVFVPRFVRPIRRSLWSLAPLSRLQAGRRAVRFERGRAEHHRLRNRFLGGEVFRYPGEDALAAPPLPPIAKRSLAAHIPRGIASLQAIAIGGEYATQNTPVITARLAAAFRGERLKPGHQCARQPERVAHRSVPLRRPNHTVGR